MFLRRTHELPSLQFGNQRRRQLDGAPTRLGFWLLEDTASLSAANLRRTAIPIHIRPCKPQDFRLAQAQVRAERDGHAIRVNGGIDHLHEFGGREHIFFNDARLPFFVVFPFRQLLDALGNIRRRYVVADRIEADRCQNAKALIAGELTMRTPRALIDLPRALTGTLLLAAASMAFAAEPPADQATPSQEMRDQMAAVHQRMAACLRSDKPIADCREEMRQNCAKFMGEQDCPMMGMRGRMPRQDK